MGWLALFPKSTSIQECSIIFDGHCHYDLMILNQPLSEIKPQQGVTTEVVGNCGTDQLHFLLKTENCFGSILNPYW
jgi:N-acyl-D-amino-acid deacylase